MPETKNRFAFPLILMGLVAAVMIAYGAGNRIEPATIAYIDLERVFNTIDCHKSRESSLEQLAEQLTAEVDAINEKIRELEAELDSFQPGSDAQLELTQQVTQAIGEYQALTKYAQLKIETEKSRSMRLTYLEIRESAGRLSQNLGIDIVLLDDSIPELDQTNSAGTLQQISARRMIYTNPKLDISDMLIEQMNKEHAGNGG